MSIATRPVDGDAGLRTGIGGVRGGGAYFPPPTVALDNILVAEIISHNEVLVSIDKAAVPADPGAGAWLELTLTANPQGVPVTNLDGTILSRYDTTVIDGWQTFRHARLLPGHWMHYGLFAKYNFGGSLQWRLVAEKSVLVPSNFDYSRRMFLGLPRWYQDADDDSPEHIVARMLKAFGMEIDISRTWVESLGDVWDAAVVPAHLLKNLSEVLGLPHESTVGAPRVRKLLSNLVYLRKLKGTKESIEGYLTALSGHTVLTHQSLNIMLTVEDGEFREGVGNWVSTSGSVSRTSAVAGGAPPAPLGLLQILNDTGGAAAVSAILGDGGVTKMVALDAGTGRQLAVSYNARSTSGSINTSASLHFYEVDGTFISTVTSANLGLTTTFDRVHTAWLNVPDAARYVRPEIATVSIADGLGIEVGQIMLVDRRWRPEYLPGYTNAEPLSEPGDDRYTGYDFYDAPRSVWLNVFPQRTNFAVNSDFTLNNLPADGWTVTDAPTYGGLPFAYSTYALVASGEADYADLAAGYNSITPTWTVGFDTTARRLEMISSPAAPFMAQVKAKGFPVLPGVAYSAAVDVQASVAGTSMTMRIQWMAKDDSNTALVDADGAPIVSEGATYPVPTAGVTRIDLRNAVAPEGAGFGRLIIDSYNTVAHTTYVHNALIEDAPVPGSYFNGDVKDGAHGDFGYVGTAKQSFSVYYLNYKAVLGSSSNRIKTAASTVLPVHVNEPRITGAYDGLYDELA